MTSSVWKKETPRQRLCFEYFFYICGTYHILLKFLCTPTLPTVNIQSVALELDD